MFLSFFRRKLREVRPVENGNGFRIGDVVVPIPPFVLASGCQRYTHAIVVNAEPLVVASEQGDMSWFATLSDGCVMPLCQAHPAITYRVTQLPHIRLLIRDVLQAAKRKSGY